MTPYSNAHASRGFTLIEVMVVLVILGVLIGLVAPNVIGEAENARVSAAKTDIATIEGQLERYKLQNYNYPSTQQGLAALVSQPSGDPPARNWAGPYIKKVPTDPWQNEYQYLSPGVKGEVDIYSFGRDGRPGGTGPDADIGNWDAETQ